MNTKQLVALATIALMSVPAFGLDGWKVENTGSNVKVEIYSKEQAKGTDAFVSKYEVQTEVPGDNTNNEQPEETTGMSTWKKLAIGAGIATAVVATGAAAYYGYNNFGNVPAVDSLDLMDRLHILID